MQDREMKIGRKFWT